MSKNVVKINEETLRKIIAESVKKALNEIGDTPKGQYAIGALAGRKFAKGGDYRAKAYKHRDALAKFNGSHDDQVADFLDSLADDNLNQAKDIYQRGRDESFDNFSNYKDEDGGGIDYISSIDKGMDDYLKNHDS